MAKTYLTVCLMFLALVIDITSSLSSVAAGSRGNVYHVARAQKARTLRMMSTAMSGDNSKSFINQANAWCGLNGLLYSAGDMKYQAAPVALIPNTFPKAAFEYAQEMQPAINELVDTISRDKEFLLQHLVSVGESDTFVRKLLDIYESLPEDIIKSSVHLGLHRSDYMLNVDGNGAQTPLQVEINTIASSFGCLSKKVGDFHRYMLQRNSNSVAYKNLLQQTSGDSTLENLLQVASKVPENTSIKMLAFGLAMAHFVYGDNKASILFIVQPGERNIADQRLLEAELWTAHGARVEFMTLAQVAENSRLGQANALYVRPSGDLYVSKADDVKTVGGGEDEEMEREQEREGEVLISVAYYRAGYAPTDYPTDKEWEARGLIENSVATKCPTVGYQLAGTKKIQQVLCEEGMVEKFLTEPESVLLRKCFAEQYSLSPLSSPLTSSATRAAMLGAMQNGSPWVLKPQREGGGNNLYGAELVEFLQKYQEDSVLSGYVLMKRIFPKSQTTAFLRQGELLVLPSISELGIYGVFLGDGSSTPLLNSCAGYLLRTKPDGVDEGGVAAGFSVLNSVILVDDTQ